MMKADKIAMLHSLEGRFPFLTRDILRFARALPDRWLINGDGTSKHILKHAFRNDLPQEVLFRRKMGFSVPTHEVLRQCRDQYHDALGVVRKSDASEVLDFEAAEKAYAAFEDGHQQLALKVWTLFVLIAWLANRYAGARTVQNRSAVHEYVA